MFGAGNVPSIKSRCQTKERAQPDRHEQGAEHRHDGRQGQAPFRLDHVDLP